MLKARSVLVSVLFVALVSSSLVGSSWRIKADSATAPQETTVSPVSDPDPRDSTSIAVSKQNDQIIVGASKVVQGGAGPSQGNLLVAYYFSSDGGHTWGSDLLSLETPQKTWGRATDPSIACDLDGNFYLGALLLDNSSFDTGVYVFKSTDGGRTFKDPVPVVVDIGNLTNPTRAGKPFLGVDASPSSPFKNTIYTVWTSTAEDETGRNGTVIRFARRRPGDSAFSTSKPIGHLGDMRGPSLATGPNGEFYAAWVGMPARSVLFNASTDGGDTFLPGLGSVDMTVHNYVGSLDGPNAPFTIAGLQRQNSFPTIDVDRSDGPSRGRVYVAWAETTNGFDTDIFLIRITPQPGLLPVFSSPPIRVNDDGSGFDQFLPWLSVDSTTGSVNVAFYDRRDSGGSLLMNMYLARSTDGGMSFGEDTRISSASSDPRVQADVAAKNSTAIGIGDYIGIAAARGKTHLLWTDTRRNAQQIFYGQMDFGSTTTPPGPFADDCSNPRAITSLPFQDVVDTRSATSSPGDPVTCTGGQDTNSIWYSITPSANAEYGIDTSLSDYDTVVSVYTGACDALVPVACSDDVTDPANATNRSVSAFFAQSGTRYLIEVSGKGSGGSLRIRIGYPTITHIEFTDSPFGDALRIDGAGFVIRNAAVTAQRDGEDIPLPNVSFLDPVPSDGTAAVVYASKKKLFKKLVKRGSFVVRVESPIGSGQISNPFVFTR